MTWFSGRDIGDEDPEPKRARPAVSPHLPRRYDPDRVALIRAALQQGREDREKQRAKEETRKTMAREYAKIERSLAEAQR